MRKVAFCIIATAFTILLAAPAFALVDINTASASELDTLPGIGPAYAKRIMEYRETNGPFRSINDIVRVRGIGPKTFQKLKDKITVGGGAPAERKKAPPRAQQQQAPPPEIPTPIDVPVFSMENKKMLKCWRCKNVFIVSGDLKSGWCPYCMEKWSAK